MTEGVKHLSNAERVALSTQATAIAASPAPGLDTRSGKQFVFVAHFDGTNNDKDNLKLSGSKLTTNVAQLHLQMKPESDSSSNFKSNYYRGVGTDPGIEGVLEASIRKKSAPQVWTQVCPSSTNACTMPSPLSCFILRWFFTLLLTCFMTTSLTACAKEDRVVFHSFNYNMPVDSPGAELLACQYGNTLGTATAQELARGARQLDKEICSNITGEMLIGDFLNVKWRDKATQQDYEERVDLKSRLPSAEHMRGKEVYFLIDNNQLYVYLIPDWDIDSKRNHLPPGESPNGPDGYGFLDVKTLYPDNDPPAVRGGGK